jgi:methanol metabolism-related c-type cytochrome
VKQFGFSLVVAAAACCSLSLAAGAEDLNSLTAKMITTPDGFKTQEGSKDDNGKWVLPDGSPTYHIAKDGKFDWPAYSGFRRYHSECHVCHGPEGEGSTYAPALKDSLKTMSYADFLGVVASGRIRNEAGTEFVMPALGDNKNVMCYIDDIYVYLKGRADGAIPRGRPPGRVDKSQAAKDAEKACLGS